MWNVSWPQAVAGSHLWVSRFLLLTPPSMNQNFSVLSQSFPISAVQSVSPVAQATPTDPKRLIYCDDFLVVVRSQEVFI